MKTYLFEWIEYHQHKVKANTPEEAIEVFNSESDEGFGGSDTFESEECNYPVEVRE